VRNASSLASLASSQITLPAGTYFVQWSAPANYVGAHLTRLQNITDSTTIETGTSEFCESSTVTLNTNRSFGSAVFTLSTSKAIALSTSAASRAPRMGSALPPTSAPRKSTPGSTSGRWGDAIESHPLPPDHGARYPPFRHSEPVDDIVACLTAEMEFLTRAAQRAPRRPRVLCRLQRRGRARDRTLKSQEHRHMANAIPAQLVNDARHHRHH
jgi:hypothetical protein